jgi:carboxymethylenebutenolidase
MRRRHCDGGAELTFLRRPNAAEDQMPGQTIRISARDGAFDCYLATPASDAPTSAVVLASAIHGVDADIRAIADEFALAGFIAAAPDLFWRTIPGPLPREDKRAAERAQPRLPRIEAGEADMADTLAHLRGLPNFNGGAAAMGFCYGGPYAILGPKRLGYTAGISCHGTQLLDYIGELEGVTAPLCILWGDQDHVAPAAVLDAYRAVPPRMPNVEVHIFPGVQHGYMMPGHAGAFDAKARTFSMLRALNLLEGLKDAQVRAAE